MCFKASIQKWLPSKNKNPRFGMSVAIGGLQSSCMIIVPRCLLFIATRATSDTAHHPHLCGIMEYFSCGVETEVVEWGYPGFAPPLPLLPVYLQHVVSEVTTEHQVVDRRFRSQLFFLTELDFDILCLELKVEMSIFSIFQ